MKVSNGLLLALTILVVLSGLVFLEVHSLPNTIASESRIRVIASFFPLYDFARNVAGDRAEVDVLVPLSMEVHDWEPVAEDVVKLKTARVFIFNGGGLEPWVENVLTQAENPK